MAAVETKDDYPCEIPDAVWHRIAKNRQATLDFVCDTIRMVKENIRNRMLYGE